MALLVNTNFRLDDAVILALALKTEALKIEVEEGSSIHSLKQKAIKFCDDLVEANRSNQMISQLSKLNKICDKRLRALRRHLWAVIDLDSPELGPPAQKLFDLFEKYGIKMLLLPNDEQYTKMCGFKRDLQDPKIQTCISQVASCNIFVDAFFVSLDNYATYRTQYFDFLTKRRNSSTGTELKSGFAKFFNTEFSEFISYQKTYGGILYTEIYENLKTEIDRISEAVHRRHNLALKKAKQKQEKLYPEDIEDTCIE